MKIFCKYCGASVDVKKETICSNCGADLSLDKEVIDYHSKKNRLEFEHDKMRLKIQQLDYEKRQLDLEQYKEKEKAEKVKKNTAFFQL